VNRFVLSAALAALALAAAAHAGPITKQNGSSPVVGAFTSICAVPGYAHYGYCNGDTATFSAVGARMNAVQPKPGTYNLDFAFSALAPGVSYRLWSTRDGMTWTVEGTAVADETGAVSFSVRTTAPAGLGFDLNTEEPNITLVTTWWSGQTLVVNPDGTLGTAS
jgi:hypothetical protein